MRLAAAMRLRGLWRAGVYHDWMDRAGRIRPATIRAALVIPAPWSRTGALDPVALRSVPGCTTCTPGRRETAWPVKRLIS